MSDGMTRRGNMPSRRKTAAYDVHDVASTIISEALALGTPISNLQLQKMLYLCQLAYVREHAKLLFPEPIVAWQYGPVVKVSYYEYAYKGASSLRNPHATKDMVDGVWVGSSVPVRSLGGEALSVIRPIVRTWCERPLWDIVGETHKRGGPWDLTYNPMGRPAGAGYGDVIDPWEYARFYDPGTCTVSLGAQPDGVADAGDSVEASEGPDGTVGSSDGMTDETTDGKPDGTPGLEVTVRVPPHLAGVLHERSRAHGKTEQEYLEGLVLALLGCV